MPKRYRRSALALSVAAAVTGGLMTAAMPAVAEEATLHGDFNADGYRDVVVSASNARVDGAFGAGQIVVYWGGPDGLQPDRRSPIHQDSRGVPGSPEEGDGFGAMTYAGDFDGDGVTDLAVGAPGEDLTGDKDSGMLTVLWGSASGLVSGDTLANPTKFDGDFFGKAIVAGDFDGDGVTDLAAGSSSTTVVFYQQGIDRAGEATESRSVRTPILPGEGGVFFLTAGDVDGNGADDLVVNGFDSEAESGYHWNANFYYRGVAGTGIAGSADRMTPGIITGIGDTNGDGFGDLVIGESWDEGPPGSVKGGKVSIRYGTPDGPNGVVKEITQDTGGIAGGSEKDDAFGAELDLGDVNGDGLMDLVIGSAGENLGEDFDTGAVHLLYGSPTGITPTGAQYFNQDVAGIPGSNEDEDFFGSDVHLADVDGDGNADLTIGASGENNDNGAVTALRSDGAKITTSGAQWMSATSAGVSTSGRPLFGVNFAG